MVKETGFFSLVLHAHLPFVRHPEHEQFLEERWFFEAVVETYVPLLQLLAGWEREHLDFLTRVDRAVVEAVWNDNHFWPL